MAPPYVNPFINLPPDSPSSDDGDLLNDEGEANDEEEVNDADILMDDEVNDADILIDDGEEINVDDMSIDEGEDRNEEEDRYEMNLWREQEKEYLRHICGNAFTEIDVSTVPIREGEGYTDEIQHKLIRLWINLWNQRMGEDRLREDLVDDLLREESIQIREREDFGAVLHLANSGYSGRIIFPTAYVRDNFLPQIDSSVVPKFSHEVIVDHDSDLDTFSLNTGGKIPAVGFSTCKIKPDLVGKAVKDAIEVGYRHIDCAPINDNEKEIGIALKELLDDGVVKREELFISSKLWCTDHAQEDVAVALDKTLKDLQLDYIDLYLIHWPVRLAKGSTEVEPENLRPLDIGSTWAAMEALYYSGKTRAIGVSNFSIEKLDAVMQIARVHPAVDQVECHPMWPQYELHKYCHFKRVHLSGYSPLGDLTHPYIVRRAQMEQKTPAQYVLMWGLACDHSVLPSSSSTDRIRENFGVFDWMKADAEYHTSLPRVRLNTGTEFISETHGDYRTMADLWDEETDG